MSFEKVIIGNAELYCGDCMEILPTLPKVDVVITDPPYEITASGGGIGAKRDYLKQTHGFTDSGFDYNLLDGFDNWVVFGTLRQIPKLIEKADARRWMLITWNKPNPTPLSNGNYLPDTEYIIHAWKNGYLHGTTREKARFFVYPAGHKEDGTHPNEKPVAVMHKVITNASNKKAIVLDPFMGSGTTGVACMNLDRKFIGIELEPKYFDIACKRIEKAQQQLKLF